MLSSAYFRRCRIALLLAGEAAVAFAAEQQDLHTGSDADKVITVGARILASMTPFVAAAAQRVTPDEVFSLTSRLHQVMLAAAGLASRQHAQQLSTTAGAASAPGSSAAAAAANGHVSRGPSAVELDTRSNWQQQEGQQQQQAAAGTSQLDRKLSARLRRMEARKEAIQQRMLRMQDKQQAKQQQRSLRDASSGMHRRVHVTDLGLHTHMPGSFGIHGLHRRSVGPDPGLALGGDMPQLQYQADVLPPRVPDEDLAHPWVWDVTQPLTTLSGGVKVRKVLWLPWWAMW